MKLYSLLEVRYAGSLEADPVLYALWKERNKIEKDNLSVVKIKDPALSKKRVAAIVRYAIRVIASEALDAVALTDEAQTLRDLPPDVDLDRAHDAAYAAYAAAYADAVARDADYAVAFAVDYATDAARIAATDAEYATLNAYTVARYASRATGNKQRYLYHLDQMIKIAADIK